MHLDLELLTESWTCQRDEICARVVRGYDGVDLIQLRVDLGVLQMQPDGRPDGARYHGLPSVLAFIQHEQRAGRALPPQAWPDLRRELQQLNYRRLALCALGESSQERDAAVCRSMNERALRDIDDCLAIVELLAVHEPAEASVHVTLRGALLFSRARAGSLLHMVDGRVEDAVDVLEQGAAALSDFLGEQGVEEDAREGDPAVRTLREMADQLRGEHGVSQTLRERLAAAIEAEDFKLAAQLRDELRRRGEASGDAG